MLENWPILTGFILLLYLSSACSDGSSGAQPSSDAVHDSSISKREVSGLFPFPRVGRSESALPDDQWESQEPMMYKRQGLIPFPRVGKRHRGLFTFPRVGRSGEETVSQHRHLLNPNPFLGNLLTSDDVSTTFDRGVLGRSTVKRSTGQGGAVGLWFGPRLGRRKRSNMQDVSSPNYLRSRHLDSYRGSEPSWSNVGDYPCGSVGQHENLRSVLRSKGWEQTAAEGEVEAEGDEMEEYETVSSEGDSEASEVDDVDLFRGDQHQRRQPKDANTKMTAARFLKARGLSE